MNKDQQKDLIKQAKTLSSNVKLTDDAILGYCGAAILSDNGKIYTGKSLSGQVGVAFCGEVGAVMEMTKDGQSKAVAMVAMSNDDKFMPPCGRCREMFIQINRDNMDMQIITSEDSMVKLRDIFLEPWNILWDEES